MPKLEQELKQNRPFPAIEQEVTVALLRTADALYRAVNAVAKVEGLNMEQYNVLRILRGAGEHGLPTLEIPKRTIRREPGITRLLDKLEKKGLVMRKRPDGDRRKVICLITKAGLQCLARLDKSLAPVWKRGISRLSARSARELLSHLASVREAL
ncbi:MarR family winged helix-turn-helix transcriptional regulator [Edaphobacter bradus]|uniref:MarR family winged helix-turn-helix transcriptional regulator n=1 Tax=Edaphobacter bradus TaxID=2259016 RepID=UPI0021E05CA4|nr:MarR family transcriptional regulator [Edaphobacter bradus]